MVSDNIYIFTVGFLFVCLHFIKFMCINYFGAGTNNGVNRTDNIFFYTSRVEKDP